MYGLWHIAWRLLHCWRYGCASLSKIALRQADGASTLDYGDVVILATWVQEILLSVTVLHQHQVSLLAHHCALSADDHVAAYIHLTLGEFRLTTAPSEASYMYICRSSVASQLAGACSLKKLSKTLLNAAGCSSITCKTWLAADFL